MTPRLVTVAAAVIEDQDRILVTRRLDGTHLAGLWEFPGGKCEPDESIVDCLRRELREELGVEATVGAGILVTRHEYPERVVELHFFRCGIDRPPQALLGQDMRWVQRHDLRGIEFPPADAELIDVLSRD